MSFSAINTVEQEIRQRNERHTLELQLEQAMGVYQSALEAQSRQDFDQAELSYRKLFSYDVLKRRLTSAKSAATTLQLGPATRLRAMALKNYALLLLVQADVTTETAKEAMGYLAEALDLVGTEDSEKLVLPSMAQISWSLGEKRMARLALEQMAENTEGSALRPLEIWINDKESATRLLGPNTIKTLQALDYIKKPTNIKYEESPRMLNGFHNLKRLHETEPSLDEVLEQEGSAEVTLTELTFKRLLMVINETLNSACRRSKRKSHRDMYSWAQRELWKVTFVGAPYANETHESAPATPLTPHDTMTIDRTPPENEQLEEESTKSGMMVDAPHELKVEYKTPSPAPQEEPTEESNPPSRFSTPPNIKTNIENTIGEGTNTEEHPLSETLDHSRPSEPISGDQVNTLGAKPDELMLDAPPRKSRLDVASPIKRRRAERVKRSDLVLPADFGLVDANFVQQFNLYLALADPELHMTSPAFLFLPQNGEIPPELAEAAELRDILSKWDQKESNQFLGGASNIRNKQGKGSSSSILKGNKSILRIQTQNIEGHEDEDEEEDEDTIEERRLIEAQEVENFVKKYNGLHIQQIRWALAEYLLEKLTLGGCDVFFGGLVFEFLYDIDALLWERRDFIEANSVTTLYSLYADRWIRNNTDIDIELKLRRWQSISAINGGLSHLWVSAFVDQENPEATPDSTVSHFESLFQLVVDSNENIAKRFSYLQEIPAISRENTHVQISKFKAAAAFERVLQPVNTKSRKSPVSRSTINTDDEQKNLEDIKLLEAMLMPSSHPKPELTSDSEFKAIQDFLKYAPAHFKMGLWYTLLEKYEINGSTADSLLGLTKIFTETMTALNNGEPLLHTLSVSHDVGKRLVALLERNPDALDTIEQKRMSDEHTGGEETLKLLRNTVKLLQILQMFIVYDDTVNSNLMQKPSTPSWSKVLPKFRELVVMWWCIFYRLWSRYTPQTYESSPETFNDILSIIHERLGNLGYCGASNGCLLNLHCAEIVKINWVGSSMDLSQCLKCKFGLTLSLYGDVANHHSIPEALDSVQAKQLMPLVTKLILGHRSFNQLVMRMDTRAVIDEFAKEYRVTDGTKLKNRIERVKQYFNKDFTPTMLKNSCMGIIDGSLSFPNSDSGSGVWVLQGIVMVNQYRMRRRQVYSPSSIRIESLETAVDLFQSDLAAHPTRFESWVSIAQIFQYMCEDCLTFGDELSIPNTPAIYCQKALLAVSAAVAIKVGVVDSVKCSLQSELFESLDAAIFPLYGYLLYLAVMPPLKKIPFKTSSRPTRPFLVSTPNAKYHQIALTQTPEITERQALKKSFLFLTTAQKQHKDWPRALYLSNMAVLLRLSVDAIISCVAKSRAIAPSNAYDADYMLVFSIWTLLRDQKIDESRALKELSVLQNDKNHAVLSQSDANVMIPNQKALQLIESCLRHLIEADKWMHQPRFLLSKMFEVDYNDAKKAQEELMLLFSLKSPSKPLVLWKRDTDLPGQHSVDISEYVRYMSDLMFMNNDSPGLLLMTKRFRKVGWEMWDHAATFEHVYQKAITLTRKLIPKASDPKYSDTLLARYSSSNSETFEVLAKAMCDPNYANFGDNNNWIKVLIYTTELRKNHSGPATISMADDVMIIVYLNIMQHFESVHPEIMKDHAAKVAAAESMKAEAEKAHAEKVQAEKAQAAQSLGANGGQSEATKPEKELKARKKPSASTNRKRIIRKDVIVAAQQFLKPFSGDQITKVEENGLPSTL